LVSCEVSLYPMETTDSDQIINKALSSIQSQGVNCEVGPLSTFISGPPEKVWQAMRILYDTASTNSKEVSMVMTVSNSVE
jgi:uncharacterized protein YqgV (UPF0045/DUF77 family)